MAQRASADYEQPEKNVADMRDPVKLPTNKARGAENRGHMFWVLTIGIALVVVAFAAIYLGFFGAGAPNT
ncbi:MAG: hypothetical protein KF826_08230 [Xanthobacteraceae bacterium]|nr:hypothetical protein [Xanthobacteraceae bacterium]MBX3534325.1 hypothetical protein [Xanthobacteraceae bacterium]MBX3550130.1 hypothetical protein [Xanthobacteraceae bacterium]MCW5677476.1 hypothetical protein [Xanthobacteraceae bacterium]